MFILSSNLQSTILTELGETLHPLLFGLSPTSHQSPPSLYSAVHGIHHRWEGLLQPLEELRMCLARNVRPQCMEGRAFPLELRLHELPDKAIYILALDVAAEGGFGEHVLEERRRHQLRETDSLDDAPYVTPAPALIAVRQHPDRVENGWKLRACVEKIDQKRHSAATIRGFGEVRRDDGSSHVREDVERMVDRDLTGGRHSLKMS